MKKNKVLKIAIIVVMLLIIIFLFISNQELINKKNNSNDYTIIDTTEICAEALEEIYSDDDYTYYLPCIKSSNIYIKWDNGDIHKLMDDINNGKVTMDSLIKHGLKVTKDEK